MDWDGRAGSGAAKVRPSPASGTRHHRARDAVPLELLQSAASGADTVDQHRSQRRPRGGLERPFEPVVDLDQFEQGADHASQVSQPGSPGPGPGGVERLAQRVPPGRPAMLFGVGPALEGDRGVEGGVGVRQGPPGDLLGGVHARRGLVGLAQDLVESRPLAGKTIDAPVDSVTARRQPLRLAARPLQRGRERGREFAAHFGGGTGPS